MQGMILTTNIYRPMNANASEMSVYTPEALFAEMEVSELETA